MLGSFGLFSGISHGISSPVAFNMQSLTFLRCACTGKPALVGVCKPIFSRGISAASSKRPATRCRLEKLASSLIDWHCRTAGSFGKAQDAQRATYHNRHVPAAFARGVNAMANDDYDKFVKVAIQAAQAAGKQIKQAFNEDKDVKFKGKLDLVTATDQQCEQTISATISEALPDHKFIGEEGSSAQGFTNELTDDPTW